MKIIQLSDLHFGTEEDSSVEQLKAAIADMAPDMVIVSGDFTQSATTHEYKNAKHFMDALPCPTLSVPGNHDIPGFDLWERFMRPYDKYKTYIDDNLCPFFENDQVVILGLNSARRMLPHWNWANGAISAEQINMLHSRIQEDEDRWTILVLHHPIHKIDEMPLDVTVFGGKKAMRAIEDHNIDLVLTGHIHHASVTTRGDQDHQTTYISASTALSSRLRDQENGFNVIDLDERSYNLSVYTLGNGAFTCSQSINKQKTS